MFKLCYYLFDEDIFATSEELRWHYSQDSFASLYNGRGRVVAASAYADVTVGDEHLKAQSSEPSFDVTAVEKFKTPIYMKLYTPANVH